MDGVEDLHQPVLLKESIEALNIKASGKYIDCTFGRGGHSQEILNYLDADGKLLAIDQDPQAIDYGKEKFKDDSRVEFAHANFSEILFVAKKYNFYREINGILFDLGVSSPQLNNPERGFSFRHEGPLDMRMNNTQGLSAAEWLSKASAMEITRVLKEYGQERYSKKIATAVIQLRGQEPIETTKQLADLVVRVVGRSKEQKHPATRTFQAIRIFINQELSTLEKAIDESLSLLAHSGRLLVISFHSLEDQLVKRLLHKYSHSNLPRKLPVTEEQKAKLIRVCKAIVPSEDEIKRNPRARSAKLHVMEWSKC